METVIITGASSGFGEAIAIRFLKEGYNVIAMARRADKLQLLSEKYPGRVMPAVVDIADKGVVKEVLTNLPEAFSNVTGLVNNAGLSLGFGPSQ
ncbi:SDR family NAD(P)-dependent oxidoreductase [Pantoea sp. AMG 501]|uniref:SDR family NAD(P)-dependent oxidoreductase n=1 Tax=Pantoea sp. AMG 501 TaxID=2008894 RepID=UPI000B5A94B3|nr:SDR family NAD(P)-dependent oxidoreductase [Pantoea sp. AMG 501]OWY74353.1 hypothetical protein CDN97_23965 [Pantoea sp. AMG 501]